MLRCSFAPCRWILIALTCLVALPAVAAAARVSDAYGRLPLHFQANQGQEQDEVRFSARGAGYSVFLTTGEAIVLITRPRPAAMASEQASGVGHDRQAVGLRMTLLQADPDPCRLPWMNFPERRTTSSGGIGRGGVRT